MLAILVTALCSQTTPAGDGGVLPSEPAPFDAGAEVHTAVAVHAGAPADAGVEAEGVVHVRAAVEGALTSLPSGGTQDFWGEVRPILGFEAGDDFAVEVGATFRLLIFDDLPAQRSEQIGGVLRRRDWDEASDFGQIIRQLRIARDDSVFWVRAGAVFNHTLGLGHLIHRYSNQDNADYHPAALWAGASVGPLHAEFFTSDVLGARILSGELAADLGRMFGGAAAALDRYHLALSLAHDAAQAGQVPAPKATLMHGDFSALLWRGESLRVLALGGLGSRFATRADLGLLAGIALESDLKLLKLGGTVELRKQYGGFRHGFFGPGYELSRYAGTGFSGVPLAEEMLPDGFSLFAEARLQAGDALRFDASLEVFNFGRVDADALLSLKLLSNHLLASARATAIGVGQLPRYTLTLEARLRLFAALYVLAAGGTVFFPQPDSTLERGVTGTVGIGIDFER